MSRTLRDEAETGLRSIARGGVGVSGGFGFGTRVYRNFVGFCCMSDLYHEGENSNRFNLDMVRFRGVPALLCCCFSLST